MKKIHIMTIFCIFISILLCAANLLETFLTKQLIDMPRFETVRKLAFVWFISLFFTVLKNYILELFYLGEQKIHLVSLLKTIFSFSFLFLESKRYNDDLNKVKDQITQEKALIVSIEKIAFAVFSVIGLYVLLLGQVSVSILMMLSVILVFVILISGMTSAKLSVLMYDYWDNYIKNTRKYNYISNVLVNKEYIEEKKVYSYFPFFVRKFEDEFELASQNNRTLGKKRIKLELVIDIIFWLFSFWGFFIFLYAYQKGQITIGLLISATNYLLTLFGNISDAVGGIENITNYQQLSKDKLSFFQYSDQKTHINSEEELQNFVLTLKNVQFYYKTEKKNVFHSLSFSFQKGKKYAIVGANGSGKTTLAKLLAGLYSPQSGTIVCNGKLVVLFQDFNRYPVSLEENIILTSDSKDRERLYEIEKKSGLKERIGRMRYGDRTELTALKEGGEELSGGEWQRVALARILWSDADIFILDEPTASLDPMEEIRIFETYQELLRDRTVIYITHRLGFVKNVDEIIVLDNGGIVETGTHEELIGKQGSLYRNMYKEQRVWYE